MEPVNEITISSLVSSGYEVRPCEGGSFIVTEGLNGHGPMGRVWAFSNCHDMVKFITFAHCGEKKTSNDDYLADLYKNAYKG